MRKLNPVTPGELLREEFLVPMGISQYRLAKEIGVPAQRIGEIVAGKHAVGGTTRAGAAPRVTALERPGAWPGGLGTHLVAHGFRGIAIRSGRGRHATPRGFPPGRTSGPATRGPDPRTQTRSSRCPS